MRIYIFILNLISGNDTLSLTDLVSQKMHLWWLKCTQLLPNLLLAIIVWILFLLIARLFQKLIYKLSRKISRKKTVSGLFSNVVRISIFMVGLYIGLNILGLDRIAISMLAGAGIVGLTLAFAFQDLTSNFISGVYIDVNNPFEVGDVIGSGNIMGRVEEIGLRSTTIRTLDGLHLMIPNRSIFQNNIANYSKSKTSRVEVEFSIPLQESFEKIEPMVADAIRELKGVVQDKKIEFYFTNINQTKLDVTVFFWIDVSLQPDSMLAKHAAILALLKTFKEYQIAWV